MACAPGNYFHICFHMSIDIYIYNTQSRKSIFVVTASWYHNVPKTSEVSNDLYSVQPLISVDLHACWGLLYFFNQCAYEKYINRKLTI